MADEDPTHMPPADPLAYQRAMEVQTGDNQVKGPIDVMDPEPTPGGLSDEVAVDVPEDEPVHEDDGGDIDNSHDGA